MLGRPKSALLRKADSIGRRGGSRASLPDAPAPPSAPNYGGATTAVANALASRTGVRDDAFLAAGRRGASRADAGGSRPPESVSRSTESPTVLAGRLFPGGIDYGREGIASKFVCHIDTSHRRPVDGDSTHNKPFAFWGVSTSGRPSAG